MPSALHHPDRDQISLSAVLEALSDPTRRAILRRLSRGGERACSTFTAYASKTNLSYHLARLRAAGLVRMRPAGRRRLLSLRAEDVEARFPGLLRAVLTSARGEGTRSDSVPSRARR